MNSLRGCLPRGEKEPSERMITSFWSTMTTTKLKSQPMIFLSCCKLHQGSPFATWHVSFPQCARECSQFCSSKVNHFHAVRYLIEMPEVIEELSVAMEKTGEQRQSETHRANKWCAGHTAMEALGVLMSGPPTRKTGARRLSAASPGYLCWVSLGALLARVLFFSWEWMMIIRK